MSKRLLREARHWDCLSEVDVAISCCWNVNGCPELSGRYVVSWNEALGQRLAFQKVSVDGEQLPFERIKDS